MSIVNHMSQPVYQLWIHLLQMCFGINVYKTYLKFSNVMNLTDIFNIKFSLHIQPRK